ncbi:MAG: hypothetical protein Q7T59_04170 [Candidatus Woesebacteria bacterium]|nr:hypothetical protein [Candidatus Woesebacteria bacterium]
MGKDIVMYNHEIEINSDQNKESQNDKGNLFSLLKRNILINTIKENPGSCNLPEVVENILKETLIFPQTEKVELTGSLARFAIGFGSMERHNQGKDGASKLLREVNISTNKNNFENNPWKNIITDLSESDLDMDTCFYFKPGYSLLDLYNSLEEKHKDSNNLKVEKTNIVNAFSFNLMDNFQLAITHEPIITNPGLNKLTIGISYKPVNEDYKQIMHIDVSESPIDAEKARRQKRHGGRTTKSQDMGRLTLKIENEKIIYEVTNEAKMALKGKERISTSGKNMKDILELSLRSLRIRLIHTPDDLSIKINHLFPLFDSKSLFSIRKNVQEYVSTNNNKLSTKEMSLPLKDLILCFNYDPYSTLHFLQDSNFYLLFPGLNNITSKGWRNLYLSDWLNLTTVDGNFLEPDKRSLNSLVKDQDEYSKRNLSNGFISILHAISELKDPKKEFDLMDSFNYFDSSKMVEFNQERIKSNKPTKAISYILNFFNGGLTEIEIQRLYNLYSDKKIRTEEFRKVLRELKLESKIDKQLRTVNVQGKKRSVILYGLRTVKSQNPLQLDNLIDKASEVIQHPCLDRANEYLVNNFKDLESIDKTITLKSIHNFLKSTEVLTLEALRSFSYKDFSDFYSKYNKNEKGKLSLENFQIYCRGLQIISEDVLRYPQFLNYLRLDKK